jgi:hypothetical protein
MNVAAEEGAMGPATWTAAFWTTLGGKGTPATAASAGSDAQEESKPTPTCHLYSTSSPLLSVLSRTSLTAGLPFASPFSVHEDEQGGVKLYTHEAAAKVLTNGDGMWQVRLCA